MVSHAANLLIVFALFTLCTAHFPPQCRCVCHIGRIALSKARGDCFTPGSGDCRVRLCRRFDRPGFSCCMPDISPFPIPEIGTQVPPASTPVASPEMELMPSPTVTPPSVPSTAIIPPSPVTSANMAIISFAGNDEVELIINGKSIAVHHDWSMVGSVMRDLVDGDVIGIRGKSRGGFYGIIAAIEMEDKDIVTGSGMWKARAAFKIEGGFYKWAEKSWSSCKWPVAQLVPNSDKFVYGMASAFPYATGARYVWAQGQGQFDGLYMRYVVGGEKC